MLVCPELMEKSSTGGPYRTIPAELGRQGPTVKENKNSYREICSQPGTMQDYGYEESLLGMVSEYHVYRSYQKRNI